MAKDPVCHMDVDETRTKITAEHGGKTYWFCAPGCKDRFLADPDRYLGGGAARPEPPR
jgi:Cu+-exporting ATPase